MNMHKHHLLAELLGLGRTQNPKGTVPGRLWPCPERNDTQFTGRRECPAKRSGEGSSACRSSGSVRPTLLTLPRGKSRRAAKLGPRCLSAHRPERGGATRCPSTPRSAAPLLTPSASLIDANGSVRWGEAALVLSYANSKFKKSRSGSGLPGAVDGSRTPPPASSALAASPQLAAAGAKNQSGAGRDRAGAQADKDFTSGTAPVWLCWESGNPQVVFQKGGPTHSFSPEDSFFMTS